MVCYCGNASTNTPTNQGGGLIVMNAGGAKLQLFVLNAEPGKLYFRRFFNGEWKSWQTLV